MANISVNKILKRAESCINKGNIAEAQKLYLNLLETFPKNRKAQNGLAKIKKVKTSTNPKSPNQEIINQLINFYNQNCCKNY